MPMKRNIYIYIGVIWTILCAHKTDVKEGESLLFSGYYLEVLMDNGVPYQGDYLIDSSDIIDFLEKPNIQFLNQRAKRLVNCSPWYHRVFDQSDCDTIISLYRKGDSSQFSIVKSQINDSFAFNIKKVMVYISTITIDPNTLLFPTNYRCIKYGSPLVYILDSITSSTSECSNSSFKNLVIPVPDQEYLDKWSNVPKIGVVKPYKCFFGLIRKERIEMLNNARQELPDR